MEDNKSHASEIVQPLTRRSHLDDGSAPAPEAHREPPAVTAGCHSEADLAGLLENAGPAGGGKSDTAAGGEAPKGKQDHVAMELLKWTMNMTVAFGAQISSVQCPLIWNVP